MRLSPLYRSPLAIVALLLGGCDSGIDRQALAEAARLTVAQSECESDSIRPATAAPAEGLWVYEDSAAFHRVAAMVGPAQVTEGRTHLTRRVETLESLPGDDTIRQVSDTASVRLELVPPLATPAAVYPVGPLVTLAAYEPCKPGLRQPLIRYLRRDAEGLIISDVVLHRGSSP